MKQIKNFVFKGHKVEVVVSAPHVTEAVCNCSQWRPLFENSTVVEPLLPCQHIYSYD